MHNFINSRYIDMCTVSPFLNSLSTNKTTFGWKMMELSAKNGRGYTKVTHNKITLCAISREQLNIWENRIDHRNCLLNTLLLLGHTTTFEHFWKMTFLTFDLVFDPLGTCCFWQQLVFNAKWPPEQDGMNEIQMCVGERVRVRVRVCAFFHCLALDIKMCDF